MAVRKVVVDLLSRLPLPWPHALLALWTGILLIGGPRPAKLWLDGPIYPTEVLFVIGLSALFLGATRKHLAPIRSCRPPAWLTVAFGLFALAFLVALVRGANGYGSGVVQDAGLGYFLLVPFITLAFIDRESWQDSVLKIFFWASIVTVPFVVFSHFGLTHFTPLSLSDGFVLLFSVAPLLDKWLNGSLVWFGKVYIVTISILTVAYVPSRSAILSFLVGLTAVVLLNLQTRRRRLMAATAVLAAISIGLVVYIAKPSLVNDVKPVQLVRDTVTFSSNTKGSNAEWRFDFARTLLERSLTSPSNTLIGVGLGKPSRFIWRNNGQSRAYDFRAASFGGTTGPHNGLVDLIYRLGWPATLAIVALLLFPILAGLEVFRNASRSDKLALSVLLALVLSGIVVALTSDSIRVPETAVPFAFVVGLLFARVLPLWRENFSGKKSNKPRQLWRYKAMWLAPVLALTISLGLMLPHIGQASKTERTVLTAKQTHELAVSFRKSFVGRIPSLKMRVLFGRTQCKARAEHKYYLCSLAIDNINPVTGVHSSVRNFAYKVHVARNGCWTASGYLLNLSSSPQKLHPLRACLLLR